VALTVLLRAPSSEFVREQAQGRARGPVQVVRSPHRRSARAATELYVQQQVLKVVKDGADCLEARQRHRQVAPSTRLCSEVCSEGCSEGCCEVCSEV